MSVPRTSEGTISFVWNGETFKTWYKLVGDLSSSSTPLIVLHGGPGGGHDYMLSLCDLAHKTPPVPIIFYDQIGCARSTLLPSKPNEFWTVDLFLAELENIITHFQIDRYDVLGNSWGASLAVSSVLGQRQATAGLGRLVLANCSTSIEVLNRARGELMERLGVKDVIEGHQRDGTTSDPEYKAAYRTFWANHACRMNPVPDEVQCTFKSLEHKEGGAHVLKHMFVSSTVFQTLLLTSDCLRAGPRTF